MKKVQSEESSESSQKEYYTLEDTKYDPKLILNSFYSLLKVWLKFIFTHEVHIVIWLSTFFKT